MGFIKPFSRLKNIYKGIFKAVNIFSTMFRILQTIPNIDDSEAALNSKNIVHRIIDYHM